MNIEIAEIGYLAVGTVSGIILHKILAPKYRNRELEYALEEAEYERDTWKKKFGTILSGKGLSARKENVLQSEELAVKLAQALPTMPSLLDPNIPKEDKMKQIQELLTLTNNPYAVKWGGKYIRNLAKGSPRPRYELRRDEPEEDEPEEEEEKDD